MSDALLAALRRRTMDPDSAALFKAHFASVEIGTKEDDLMGNGSIGQYITITPIWTGVDRARTSSLTLVNKPSNMALANRYKRAIESGAAFCHVELTHDSKGKSYIHAVENVMGRYLNADLKKLGY